MWLWQTEQPPCPVVRGWAAAAGRCLLTAPPSPAGLALGLGPAPERYGRLAARHEPYRLD